MTFLPYAQIINLSASLHSVSVSDSFPANYFQKGDFLLRGFIKELREMELYYKSLERKVKAISRKKVPQGRLRVSTSNGVKQYYLITQKGDTKGKYVRKDDRKILYDIAQNEYLDRTLKCSNQWLKWIARAKETMPKQSYSSLCESMRNKWELITKVELSDREYITMWESQKYEGKPFSKTDSELYTNRNERVRSKSEQSIANKLLLLNIPYRYEYPLSLNSLGTVYPDFILLKMPERTEIVYEHFGMMDDLDYAIKALKKINAYINSGYVWGKTFIATFESRDVPLDSRVLDKILSEAGLITRA